MIVWYKKLTETATAPQKGTSGAAGFDLCADINSKTIIPAGETVMIKTGLAMEIPKGFFGAIYARSGLATRQGLRPPMCVGIIDSDYRGDICVPLHNDSQVAQFVYPHTRIAQLIIQPVPAVNFREIEELRATERGSDGFGSTGM
jgi:dUTP pyrophosphatase